MEVNLVAPVYWAIEMMARIAEERLRKGKGRWAADEGIQGTVIFIGSISSSGIPGQVSYSSTKAALEGAAATLSKEPIYHGVRFAAFTPASPTPRWSGARAGVHREEHPPLHPAQAVDRSLRDRRRDLLHDLQLGGQRRALGRRWLAPIRLSERDECRGAFLPPYHEDLPGRCTVLGVPRARSNPEEKRLLDFQSSIRSKADAPLILSYPRSGETPCELVDGSSSIDFRPPLTSDSPSRPHRQKPGVGEAPGLVSFLAPHSMYSTFLVLFTWPFTSTSVGRTTISALSP